VIDNFPLNNFHFFCGAPVIKDLGKRARKKGVEKQTRTKTEKKNKKHGAAATKKFWKGGLGEQPFQNFLVAASPRFLRVVLFCFVFARLHFFELFSLYICDLDKPSAGVG
jgi:hypothetical protein